MMPGSCACCTPRRSLYGNLLTVVNPVTKPYKVNVAAQGPVQYPTKSVSNSDNKSAIVPSHASTSASSCTSTLAPVPVLVPISIKKLFKQFIKTYKASVKVLEQNGGQVGQTILVELQGRPLKAKVPDVYYSRSYIDCFPFYQQCEDYFESVGATRANRTSFAASFL